MNAIVFLASAVLAIAFATACQADTPNVLLICVDDLKPTLGCYDDPIAITPHIDRLASRGVVFQNAYCNQAVCSPSRNSLMTGMRPQTIGVYDLPTHFRLAAPDAITMTQHFIAQGYHAEGLGKIYHVGHGNIDDRSSWSVASWKPKGDEYQSRTSIDAYEKDFRGRRRGPPTERFDGDEMEYRDARIATQAIDRLTDLLTASEKPFFLAVGFMKPHLPFVAPEKYWAMYDPAELPMPALDSAPVDAPSYAPTTGGELANYSGMKKQWPPDEGMTRHLIHGYYAATSFVDAQIGRVLDELDRLQLADDTVVVLWGDHGWHLGDHGMWCKHTNYEQAARIPLIFAGPAASPGTVSAALVETVDIYPTLVELAGIDPPSAAHPISPNSLRLDGQSFAASVRDPDVEARPYVTHVYPRGDRLGRAIRDHRYRMVQWKPIGKPDSSADVELYDYKTDPSETRNLAAENPEVVQSMLLRLAEQGEAKPPYRSAKKSRSKQK